MKPNPLEPASATLAVRLTPRASSNAIMRYDHGVLFLRLSAPPVEGAANAACCQFVAKLLGVPPSNVSLKSGHKSRAKTLALAGMTQEAIEAALSLYAASQSEGGGNEQ